jgi:hypothetical protein
MFVNRLCPDRLGSCASLTSTVFTLVGAIVPLAMKEKMLIQKDRSIASLDWVEAVDKQLGHSQMVLPFVHLRALQ